MKAPNKQGYRKLTRMGRGVGTMSQLWLADDHLMQATSTGYTESYQRFYLRDIQSLLLVHGGRRLYIGLTLGLLGSICLVTAWGNEWEWPAYAVIGGIFLPLLLWNQLLGAGCRVTIVTAVQQDKLHALVRLPKARRVIADLSVMIQEAQIDLTEPVTMVATDAPPVLEPVLLSEPPTLPPPLPES